MSVAWLLNRQSSEKDRDKFLLPFHYGWSFCAEDAWIHSGDRRDTSDFCASFVHFSWFFYIEFADVNLFFKKEKKNQLWFCTFWFVLAFLFVFLLFFFIVELHWKAYKCSVLSQKLLILIIYKNNFYCVCSLIDMNISPYLVCFNVMKNTNTFFHMVIFYYYDQINFKIHGVWNFKIKYLKN